MTREITINQFEFEDFQRSGREVSDLGAVLNDDIYKDAGGSVYDGDCFISVVDSTFQSDRSQGKYHLIIERSEWQSDNLVELEETLWASHYVIEHDVTITEQSIGAFLRGYCRSINAECDGDLFGHVFGDVDGQEEWSGPPLQDQVYRLAQTFKLFAHQQPPKVTVWLASMETEKFSWEAGGKTEADARNAIWLFFTQTVRRSIKESGDAPNPRFETFKNADDLDNYYGIRTREVSDTFTNQM